MAPATTSRRGALFGCRTGSILGPLHKEIITHYIATLVKRHPTDPSEMSDSTGKRVKALGSLADQDAQ